MHYGTKTGAENRCQKMESIYCADFWSVCHGYYTVIIHSDFVSDCDAVSTDSGWVTVV